LRIIISLPIVIESIGLGLFFLLSVFESSRFSSSSGDFVSLVELSKHLVSLLDMVLDEPGPEGTLSKGEYQHGSEPERGFHNEEPCVPSAKSSRGYRLS
jgi:hypothetical protein